MTFARSPFPNATASIPNYRSFPCTQGVVLPCCIPAKGERASTSAPPVKLVVRPEADGSEVFVADSGVASELDPHHDWTHRSISDIKTGPGSI